MSNAPKTSVRQPRSICSVHYNLRRREQMARPLVMPSSAPHVQAYGRQVAGHHDTHDTQYLGLLQCNDGTILKPILKEAQKREVEFYTRLATTTEGDLVELRKLVPKYFGTTLYTYNGYTQEYIILEDLCSRMLEPCIMDVKIGKRTWDPTASPEKRSKEDSKYGRCKQQYGFCIPGYQVRRLATATSCHYGKDYGKRLHGQAVVDAIRNYLNGTGSEGLCRALVLQFLSQLWAIQAWARRQTSVKLYAASILLLYDAERLRDCCGTAPVMSSPKVCTAVPPRRRSIHSLHSLDDSTFSGQLSSKGPFYKKLSPVPLTPLKLAQTSFTSPPPISSPWSDALERLNHNHSFDHNYEDKLSKIKMNYRATLDQLSYDSPNPNPWGTVKIIDFAHAFFNEEDDRSLDDNFREGIDNFVEIFECFLRETDDQVI